MGSEYKGRFWVEISSKRFEDFSEFVASQVSPVPWNHSSFFSLACNYMPLLHSQLHSLILCSTHKESERHRVSSYFANICGSFFEVWSTFDLTSKFHLWSIFFFPQKIRKAIISPKKFSLFFFHNFIVW